MAHFAGAGLKHGRRLSVDGLPAARSDGDKPDFKELDLASPAASMSAATSSSSSSDSNCRRRTGHGRSNSTSSATSHVFPSGNICPSGRIGKPAPAAAARGVAAAGVSPAGGNIQSAGVAVMARRAIASGDPEEVRRVGNEQYRKGSFAEALGLYDRAIAMAPDDAACRSNRAAALIGLGRLPEAVVECELAIGLDPSFGRAHQRLSSLLLRLGQVEIARKHLLSMQFPDPIDLAKLRGVEKRFTRCIEARRTGDWKSALREGDAAIAAGADLSPQLLALRAESLLKLHQLVDADLAILNIPRYEFSASSCARSKFCGMLCDSYPFFVRAQVEMAMGRFENAVAAAEKAGQFDSCNTEIVIVIKNIKSVARARVQGNDLFNAGKYHDACLAYGDGLKLDPFNPLLFCNRAACRFKLGHWDKAIDDCNEALRIRPNYSKALLRRAACYEKLDKWDESVRDYEILRKELPEDLKVAEALFHAQVALKNSWGEVHNMKFGGEVEEISGLDPFKAAVSSPGIFVVYFMLASNIRCQQMSPFVDQLCAKYPSINFLKVNVDNNHSLANAENVKIVPTVKIYKNGARVKEMICPNQQVLDYTVRHYSL